MPVPRARAAYPRRLRASVSAGKRVASLQLAKWSLSEVRLLDGVAVLTCDGILPSGIKAIKLYAWEEPFKKRIEALRAAELHEIRCMVVITSLPSPASSHDTLQTVLRRNATFTVGAVLTIHERVWCFTTGLQACDLPVTHPEPFAHSVGRVNALLEAVNFTLVMSTPILVAIAGFATFVLTVRHSCCLWRRRRRSSG